MVILWDPKHQGTARLLSILGTPKILDLKHPRDNAWYDIKHCHMTFWEYGELIYYNHDVFVKIKKHRRLNFWKFEVTKRQKSGDGGGVMVILEV